MPHAPATASLPFTGFADRDARFFRALAKHQDRDWFHAHRDEYEHGWRQPMAALLATVHDRIDRFFPRQALATPKVFRINRDVRFGKDKSPYKTHIGGYIAVDGGSGPAAPAPLYLHVSPDETFAAAGHYMMLPPQLSRFRAAVLDDHLGAALTRLLAPLARAGFTLGSYDVLQRVPRGVDPAHQRAELLKRKGLMVTFPALPRPLLVSPKLIPWLTNHVKRTAPLVEWLAALDD
jgi:uncharacterized protein (TIGR02453 family)